MIPMRTLRIRLSAVPLALLLSASVLRSEVRVQILPNETVPSQVVLENDGLRTSVSIGRNLYFTSFYDKLGGVEFVDSSRPAPVVNINNTWHLLQLGFNIWQVRPLESASGKGVEIELFSNYLENAYHLFVRLTLSDRPELRLDLSVANQAKEGLHDVPFASRPSLTSGLSFLKFLTPKDAGTPSIIFKRGFVSYHNDTADLGMYFLRQPDAPTFPLVVSYPKIRAGVLLNKEYSDWNWSFQNAEEALAFMQTTPLAPGKSLVLFRGVLKPFRGEWHAALDWWKAWVRSQLNLEYYRRAGHQQYRKQILGNFAMAFDHEFYDPVNHRYRLREFLEKGKREFGGYDFIIFWHGYPRLGVDSRDEWAMYHDLPGGIEGLRKLIQEANTQSVSVFLSFNPWDMIGKRHDLLQAQASIMRDTGANGTYLDILPGASAEFRAVFDNVNPDIVFSSEGRPSLKGLEVSTGSQEDHEYMNEMPRLDLLRFVFPEHNIQNTERASRNRAGMIRNALFNFTGLTVWENIFGEINRFGWAERILIYRFNRLAHDYMDAFLDTAPVPMVPARQLSPSQGRTSLETSHPAVAIHDEALVNEQGRLSGLYVNQYRGQDKFVYSLYHRDHEKVDRYHDNRAIGKLFKVDFPRDWHLINIWEGLPAKVVEDSSGRWAFVSNELGDPSCVFAAMPKIISVKPESTSWMARVPRGSSGTLRLVGMDTAYRPVYKPAVPASQGLRFRAGDAEANVESYVMVQYLIDGVVRDAVAVRIED